MRVEYAGMTDKGLKRTVNQDAIAMLCQNGMGLFIVADGMGGHENGELASAAIVEYVKKWWEEFQSENRERLFMDIVADIQQCLGQANRKVFQDYNQHGVCGSTLVLLFAYQNKYAIISAGDSRVYVLYKRKLCQLTTDEIWDNMPQTISTFTARKIKEHPSRGKLTNAFGTKEKLSLSIKTEMLSPRQLFLLCSDGVSKMCSEKRLRKILQFYQKGVSLAGVVEKLKEEVYKNGASDNLSVILVGIDL